MNTRANSSISKLIMSAALGLATLISTNAMANNCSMQQIDQYLKKGFSHDQVVKLCTATAPKAQQAPVASGNLYDSLSGTTSNTASPATQSSPQTANSEDQLYFATVLEGSPVKVSNDKLSYESKECAVYGERDISETRDKACIRSRVNIIFDGLQVVRAQKGVMLIREQELIVKGNITREYLDTGKLNKYQMQAVQSQLPMEMTTLNIPVKKGINPKDVVARLNRFIN